MVTELQVPTLAEAFDKDRESKDDCMKISISAPGRKGSKVWRKRGNH
jgi:hypothetical protein